MIPVTDLCSAAEFIRHEKWKQHNKIRLEFTQKFNPNNRIYHIRGRIDDVIVVRLWVKKWQEYEYMCLSDVYLMTHAKFLTVE